MQLRPYQDAAATHLYERDRAMLLAPMGAGKTAATLRAMEEMLRDGHARRFLVVAPLLHLLLVFLHLSLNHRINLEAF